MTDRNKWRICSNAVKARVELDGVILRLDKCEYHADYNSPEAVIIRNIKANMAEAYRDLEILINRTKPKPITAI